MPDDLSDLVLPIPNRTVKRVSADDSADPRVKVGHRQAITAQNAPSFDGAFLSATSFKEVADKNEKISFCLTSS